MISEIVTEYIVNNTDYKLIKNAFNDNKLEVILYPRENMLSILKYPNKRVFSIVCNEISRLFPNSKII